VNKWVYKTTANYQVSFEKDDDDNFMIHVDVYHWNRKVYKEMLADWVDIEDMLEFFDVPIVYGLIPKEREGFASLFGWVLTEHLWENTHRVAYKKMGE